MGDSLVSSLSSIVILDDRGPRMITFKAKSKEEQLQQRQSEP